MARRSRRESGNEGWQQPHTSWDGTSYADRAAKEVQKQAEAKSAQREDQERQRADAKLKRDAKRRKQQAKDLAKDRAAGVFSVVLRADDEGNRMCRRCDGMEFEKQRRNGSVGDAVARGGAGGLVGATLGPLAPITAPLGALLGAVNGFQQGAHMICQTCGAAYPLKRPTNGLFD